jgi:hypothetical protein
LFEMDVIEFVVAKQDLGNGPQTCAEPIINGERLVDILERVEGKPTGYAGLAPESLFAALDPAAERAQVQVLRCVCGDDLCSWARVAVKTGPEQVVWHNLRASRGEPASYTALGPFRFSREQYERALAARKPRLD